MSEVDIVRFKAEHMIDLIEVDQDTARRAVLIEENPGPAWSVIKDGKCIGCGGAMMVHGTVYHLWAQVSPELAKKRIAFHKLALTLFEEFSKLCQWERLEVVCETALIKNCRWVEAFGLKPYAQLEEKAGPNGETMTRFARVR